MQSVQMLMKIRGSGPEGAARAREEILSLEPQDALPHVDVDQLFAVQGEVIMRDFLDDVIATLELGRRTLIRSPFADNTFYGDTAPVIDACPFVFVSTRKSPTFRPTKSVEDRGIHPLYAEGRFNRLNAWQGEINSHYAAAWIV